MKFDFSSGKTEDGGQPKRQLYTPPYKAGETTLQQSDPVKIYKDALEWVNHFPVRVPVVGSLQQAIDARSKGEFVLSLREADIAARQLVPLDNPLLISGMVVAPQKGGSPGVMTEGIPGVENNPFELRNQYNRGVQFYKTGKYQLASVEQQRKADERMKHLRVQLREAKLPLWPHEVEEGFATELCKPEYMTWHQYQEAAKQPAFLFSMTPNEFDESASGESSTSESEEVEHVDAAS